MDENDHDGRTAIYRFYDKRNRLLYVGITNNPNARWQKHAAEKQWWPEVVRRDVEWVGSRLMAAQMESDAILSERPAYNIRGTTPAAIRQPPRPKVYQRIAAELRQRIIAGELAAGDRVPGENTLIADYGVARSTARQALALLRDEGLTSTRQGAGVRVRAREDRTVAIPIGRPALTAEILRGALTEDDLAALIEVLAS